MQKIISYCRNFVSLHEQDSRVGDLTIFLRRAWLFVFLPVLVFFIWAAIFDISKGVHVQGTVAPEMKRKVVQARITSKLTELDVKEGDLVKEGQLLIVLNKEPILAKKQALLSSFLPHYIEKQRVEAELFSRKFSLKYENLPPKVLNELIKYLQEGGAVKQDDAFRVLSKSLKNLEKDLLTGKSSLAIMQSQLDIINDRIQQMEPLVNEGLVAKIELIKYQQQQLDLSSRVTAERRQLLDAYSQNQSKMNSLYADLANVLEELDAAEIRAPAEGQFIGLNMTTKGSFITAGQNLGYVVPTGEGLIVEAIVPAKDIYTIKSGMPAEIRFSSLPKRTSPLVKGHLISVATDVLGGQDSMSKPSSLRSSLDSTGFQVRVEISKDEMKKLTWANITPGVQAEIFIDGGKRPILDYFISPVRDLFKRAMLEQ